VKLFLDLKIGRYLIMLLLIALYHYEGWETAAVVYALVVFFYLSFMLDALFEIHEELIGKKKS